MSKDLLHKLKQSAVDPTTGQRILVPGDMTYQKWYDKYVKGKSIAESKERSIDKEQFEKYKALFGDEIPDNLEKFKDLKYHNTIEWERLKAEKQDRINSMDFTEMSSLIEKLGNKEVRMWYKIHDERCV